MAVSHDEVRLSAGPWLTLEVDRALRDAALHGAGTIDCSLDLGRTRTPVTADPAGWTADGRRFPYLDDGRERTVYCWHDGRFDPVARYGTALVKLVPTSWGPPTFEIDGVKMLPTAQVSPYADARDKVALIRPRGKVILDTCAGLGYFAAWCLEGGAERVLSWEKNPDVLWLRGLNPWSPIANARLELRLGDVIDGVAALAARSVDAVLHDPPRFGLAGDLYSQRFYDELARVLKPRGLLFHYVGSPNRLTSGRDVPAEVARRLQRAGFSVRPEGDGLLAVRNR